MLGLLSASLAFARPALLPREALLRVPAACMADPIRPPEEDDVLLREQVTREVVKRIEAMQAEGMTMDQILNAPDLYAKTDVERAMEETPDSAAEAAVETEPPPAPPAAPPPPAAPAPPARAPMEARLPAPLQGEAEWGRWSNRGRNVYLELLLEEGVRAKELHVEAAEGWLIAQREATDNAVPPLIFGRFATPVEESELMWGIEDADDDQRVLCIELPKQQEVVGVGATVDCIFDESLHINGESCILPGLSEGTITLNLPKSCPSGED